MNKYMDFKTVCRICLENKPTVISIFDLTPEGLLLSEMLQECTSVFVSHNDSISKNLCIDCSKQLQVNYKFKLQCITSDHCLKDWSENDQTSRIEVPEQDVYYIFENGPNPEQNLTDFNAFERDKRDIAIDEVYIKSEDLENDQETNLNRTENNSFQCNECGIEFQLENDFMRHIRIEHGKGTKKFLGNTYTCDICHKVYSAEWGLKKHLVSHGQCKYCDKRFEDDVEFKQHVEGHKKVGYTCERCGRRFKNFVRLKIHRQMNPNFNCIK